MGNLIRNFIVLLLLVFLLIYYIPIITGQGNVFDLETLIEIIGAVVGSLFPILFTILFIFIAIKSSKNKGLAGKKSDSSTKSSVVQRLLSEQFKENGIKFGNYNFDELKKMAEDQKVKQNKK